MRILAIERELSALDPRQHADLLRKEAACVWDLKKRDVIRDIWFTQRDHRAVVLLECPTEAEARQHLQSLPLVRARYIDFDICALQPYDGFDRLIAPPATDPPALISTPIQ